MPPLNGRKPDSLLVTCHNDSTTMGLRHYDYDVTESANHMRRINDRLQPNHTVIIASYNMYLAAQRVVGGWLTQK